MSRFLTLSGLDAYVPGEQPKNYEYIKLNTNESPYPPSPEVLSAIADESKKLNLYSDPDCLELRKTLAEQYGVEDNNVIVANGSDEILSFAFQAFGGKGAIFPDITYGFYPVFSKLYGISYEEKPLKSDFSLDISDYENTGKMVVIANPNAPTGIALSVSEIEEIVASNKNSVVVIDEAYVDFGADSATLLTKKYDNLVVTMTFSKSRSLAGARVGYAIGDSELISDLNTVRCSTNPYNVNRMSLAAAKAALLSQEYYDKNAQEIIKTRGYTEDKLCELGFRVTDSKANFLFAKHEKISGERLYKQLKESGVLVRHFGNPKITDYLRITIGTKEQMDILIHKAKKIIEAEKQL